MDDAFEKITLEYVIKTSPAILFNRLSTPSGLSEWFADDVNVEENVYVFIWDKVEQRAEMVQKKENKFIRFRWLDTDHPDEEERFFEFRINQLEITGETALWVTDCVDSLERADVTELWNRQIDQLMKGMGLV